MSRRVRHDARPAWRRRALLGVWMLCAAAILTRAGQVQVVQSELWLAKAEDQHRETVELPAPRGGIFDRWGTPLAVTRERVRINVAPPEIADADAAAERLVDALGISSRRARQYVTRGRWNVVGTFAPAARAEVEGIRGVHVETVFERYRPHGALARGLLGVELDQEGRGGIEQAFDDLLRGLPGSQVVARDHRGRTIPGDQVTVRTPRAGGEVVLTIDTDLQEIAQAALQDAIDRHDAVGGDVLITDPFSGEILALFSTQNGHAGALSAVNTPFEPGSTIKPFTAAGLLSRDLASMSDSVDVGDGRWVGDHRVITDTHTEGWLTLRVALQESSNIGMAKLAERMSHGEQYETLRDFGFGSLTGVELPGEVSGLLRKPEDWSGLSQASLSYGYELSVTPLQMAMAYGALANGGRLMQPRLVREVREADGTVVQDFEPRVIRRVVESSVAAEIGQALEDVVTEGTGSLAQLGSFRVAGKSGTARVSENGQYVQGEYSSSFVGYFPAEAPQLVVFVKLDRPQEGGYYGGAIAAPVTRATMEAALAAAPPSIDLARLAENPLGRAFNLPVIRRVADAPDPALPPLREAWSDADRPAEEADGRITVPDLSGRPAREAIRNLHRFGFRVANVGTGEVVRTIPAAGSRVLPGDTIRLRFRGHSDE